MPTPLLIQVTDAAGESSELRLDTEQALIGRARGCGVPLAAN